MDKALKLSRPEVGSSSSMREGSVISSTPIAVLFRSPPESTLFNIDPIIESATAERPSSLINSLILRSCSYSVSLSLSFAANLRASLGVKCIYKMSSCITYPAIFPKIF